MRCVTRLSHNGALTIPGDADIWTLGQTEDIDKTSGTHHEGHQLTLQAIQTNLTEYTVSSRLATYRFVTLPPDAAPEPPAAGLLDAPVRGASDDMIWSISSVIGRGLVDFTTEMSWRGRARNALVVVS